MPSHSAVHSASLLHNEGAVKTFQSADNRDNLSRGLMTTFQWLIVLVAGGDSGVACAVPPVSSCLVSRRSGQRKLGINKIKQQQPCLRYAFRFALHYLRQSAFHGIEQRVVESGMIRAAWYCACSTNKVCLQATMYGWLL